MNSAVTTKSLAAEMTSGAAVPQVKPPENNGMSFKPDWANVTPETPEPKPEPKKAPSNPMASLGETTPLISDGTVEFDEAVETFHDEPEELTEDDKKRNFVYAKLYVVMMNTGVNLGSQLITGNWEEEAAKKYSLTETQQNQLAKAWAEVLNLEGKKKSPRGALVMMFASMFGVIILKAIKDAIQKRKAKKSEEAKAKAQNKKKGPQKAAKPPQTAAKPKPNPMDTLNNQAEKVVKAGTEQLTQPKVIKLPPVTGPKGTVEIDGEAVLDDAKEVVAKAVPVPQNDKGGRRVGTKRNPTTQKMEPPQSHDGTFFYYSWGEKYAISKKQREKLGL